MHYAQPGAQGIVHNETIRVYIRDKYPPRWMHELAVETIHTVNRTHFLLLNVEPAYMIFLGESTVLPHPD
jgi:hypothetical protein